MKKNTQWWIAGGIILLVLVYIGGQKWLLLQERKNQAPESTSLIQSTFPGKIVYAQNLTVGLTDLQNDCSQRQGTFNTCGDMCAPGASSCLLSCAVTCELTPEPQHPLEKIPENWKTFPMGNQNFTVMLPNNLFQEKTDLSTLEFTHAVPYPHQDPCDFKGDAPELPSFTDFQVHLELSTKDLASLVAEKEGTTFVKDNFQQNKFIESTGFVDPFSIGSLQGHQITMGVENCGFYHYYFPLPEGKILFVARNFITMMRDSEMRKKVENLPDVFLPEREDGWFRALLETFHEWK